MILAIRMNETKGGNMELQYDGRPISELSREKLIEVFDDLCLIVKRDQMGCDEELIEVIEPLYRILKRHQMRRDEEILGRKNVSVA